MFLCFLIYFLMFFSIICVFCLNVLCFLVSCFYVLCMYVCMWIFKVHNVSQWPNLRHLAEPLGGAVGLLEAVSFKEAT